MYILKEGVKGIENKKQTANDVSGKELSLNIS